MSRGGNDKRLSALPLLAVCVAVSLLAGCAGEGPTLPKISELNPFKEKQQPLPGRRIPVIETTESLSDNLADANKPIVLPPISVSLAWRFSYQEQFGVYNYLLSLIGLGPVRWLSDRNIALYSVMLTDLWQATPFVFFAAMTVVQFLVVFFTYPETKGQTLEALQRKLVAAD